MKPALLLVLVIVANISVYVLATSVDAPIDAPACTLVLGQDDDARIGVQSHAE